MNGPPEVNLPRVSEITMEQLIRRMAEDDVWKNWMSVNSAQAQAKDGCISATTKSGCISASPKAGCIS
ncbi:hypothetical protein GCM10010305_17780 [Streptomyces termitum]|uniref:Uncharacterized protein n=1 Tax=Streptomyces termitum TaxID=67368 RepID=A0A918W6Z7_9ACTN|nr:hypothetical protein GCM10010305_17780 [Streptomyces termitum]